jgi:hypothetical protein
MRRQPSEDRLPQVVEYDLEWQLAAKQLLRTEMHRQATGLLYFGGAGIAMSADDLQAKLSHEALSAAFFLQCLQAMAKADRP